MCNSEIRVVIVLIEWDDDKQLLNDYTREACRSLLVYPIFIL